MTQNCQRHSNSNFDTIPAENVRGMMASAATQRAFRQIIPDTNTDRMPPRRWPRADDGWFILARRTRAIIRHFLHLMASKEQDSARLPLNTHSCARSNPCSSCCTLSSWTDGFQLHASLLATCSLHSSVNVQKPRADKSLSIRQLRSS